MKNLKKIIALLLVVISIFTLVACSDSKKNDDDDDDDEKTEESATSSASGAESKKESDEESKSESKEESKTESSKDSMDGVWNGKMDLTEQMSEAYESVGITLDCEFVVYIELTFDGDEYEMTVDKAKFNATLDNYAEAALDATYELYKSGTADAMSKEEFFAANGGKDAMKSDITSAMDASDLEDSGTYTYKNGVLKLEGYDESITVSGDKFTMEDDGVSATFERE